MNDSQPPFEPPSPTSVPVVEGFAPPSPPYPAQPPREGEPPSGAPQAKKGVSTGLVIGLAIVVAVCIVLVVAITSCTSTLGTLTTSLGLSSPTTALVDDDQPCVAVISLDSTIEYGGGACSPEGLRQLLGQAEESDAVKAVVLRVNSGGGTATAGEEMATYVRDFSKPIVVSSASTNCSAAYEISSQADYIFTAKTTSIGSIGVAMQVTDLSGLYEKLGINVDNITSSESKDATYGNRSLSEDERAWYQAMVDQINADFIATVASGRGMAVSDVEMLANGLAFTGQDAVANGLADEVGYLDDAIAYASSLAGYETPLKTRSLTLSVASDLETLLDVLGASENATGTTLGGANTSDGGSTDASSGTSSETGASDQEALEVLNQRLDALKAS